MTSEYSMTAIHPAQQVLTVGQVADICHLSRNTVYKLVKENAFESRRIGRDIRILRTSFESWLHEQQEKM